MVVVPSKLRAAAEEIISPPFKEAFESVRLPPVEFIALPELVEILLTSTVPPVWVIPPDTLSLLFISSVIEPLFTVMPFVIATSAMSDIMSDSLFNTTPLNCKLPSDALTEKSSDVVTLFKVSEPSVSLTVPLVKTSAPEAPFNTTDPPDTSKVEPPSIVVLTASATEEFDVIERVCPSRFNSPVSALIEESAPCTTPFKLRVPPFRVVAEFQVSFESRLTIASVMVVVPASETSASLPRTSPPFKTVSVKLTLPPYAFILTPPVVTPFKESSPVLEEPRFIVPEVKVSEESK